MTFPGIQSKFTIVLIASPGHFPNKYCITRKPSLSCGACYESLNSSSSKLAVRQAIPIRCSPDGMFHSRSVSVYVRTVSTYWQTYVNREFALRNRAAGCCRILGNAYACSTAPREAFSCVQVRFVRGIWQWNACGLFEVVECESLRLVIDFYC